MQDLDIRGARVHNLKDIDVHIPRYSLTVFTGLSGSGKSSLAFDTIYAEGQRRYVETLSSYARGFLDGGMERPDVDEISGLGPVISIEQKTTNRNPRSTVGTVTEIYDFFRLLYARAGEAVSYLSGRPMVRYTEEQILDLLLQRYEGKRVMLLAPVVKQRKGHYKELFEQLRKKSYLTVRVDGELREITYGMKLDRYKLHSVEVQTDKLTISRKNEDRLLSSLRLTLKEGDGVMMLQDLDSGEIAYFSRHLMDPETGLSYNEPAPHNFSFNSTNGSCPRCKGLGEVQVIDLESIIPDRTKSIYAGGILPLGKYRRTLVFAEIEALCSRYEVSIKDPIDSLPEDLLTEIVEGSNEDLVIEDERFSSLRGVPLSYDGIGAYLMAQADEEDTRKDTEKWMAQFTRAEVCPECSGGRLNQEALHYYIDGKNIGEVASMELTQLASWLEGLEDRLSPQQRTIATEVLKEIRTRLSFLLDVGLGYLSMNRISASLSGGESQRIRLATQIGTQLVEVLYILDEPSIGLHQRDNVRLIHSLQRLRDLGNTVIVVEHDKDMMLEADHIVDMGPKAGRLGGEVVFSGTPKDMMRAGTLTAKYISGLETIEVADLRRPVTERVLRLTGARGNNLRGIDVTFPLGTMICVAGVSGSGKSTLINETLLPILSQHLYASLRDPLPYDTIEGLEYVDKVVAVDQSPIGRTPRSNPATYTGVFTDIRNLFVGLPESKMRGYKPGRFSFNVSGGRCETCSGNGYKTIEMNFLPDVLAPCEVCQGKRYNRETLEVRFKGKSIADVLDMTINAAVEFFAHVPHILKRLQVLQEVGLGYIKLGQSSTTLSGGESQRIKLASELAKRDTGKTVYILDEPTTGLHFEDIRVLLGILNRLVERGNTVIIIEHNLDVLKSADYIIEIGPEGGKDGGALLYEGTPEGLTQVKDSPTAPFLAHELKLAKGSKKGKK
ncbi:excinuclease ABC, A subunit [Porphyromonas sp. oral taxon 278 str. W7784]|uniref:excinuclease ABC subunit UvrA n=1 Tax=Porphyromonas sp. oral taxon 278 TaxID=712437 RepID=UPI0003AD477F|nr:excinuclease ABC subunit UvrA [Porphyromonas sp. oral taxon 278]ERJ72394.1 excinuclease ABC, A subunit [Porphyromonas sp. oral taxon 278 str. W7784]